MTCFSFLSSLFSYFRLFSYILPYFSVLFIVFAINFMINRFCSWKKNVLWIETLCILYQSSLNCINSSYEIMIKENRGCFFPLKCQTQKDLFKIFYYRLTCNSNKVTNLLWIKTTLRWFQNGCNRANHWRDSIMNKKIVE